MNSSAANSLLKFLEEPLEIFSGVRNRCSRKNSPTIQSRCQVLHFQELSKEALIHRLQEEQIPLKSKTFGFLNKQFRKSS